MTFQGGFGFRSAMAAKSITAIGSTSLRLVSFKPAAREGIHLLETS